MSIRNPFHAAVVSLSLAAGCFIATASWAESPPEQNGDQVSQPELPKVEPKPLADYTKKGLDYLASQQHKSGGWGQGGGWRTSGQNGGRVEGNDVADPPDLGNTCIATLALIRSGSTPTSGPYANQIAKAAEFICAQVQQANVNGLYVTDVRDTQLQRKIGQYVDTFLAGLVLSELKGHMLNEDNERQLAAALKKTVEKIEANQQEDGTFAGNTGWASVLSQSLCSKFLNRAAQQQVAVKQEVLDRDYRQSVAQLDRKTSELGTPSVATGRISGTSRAASKGGGGGDAGVDLYSSASNAGRIRYYFDANRPAEAAAKQVLASESASDDEKKQAKDELSRLEEVRGTQQAAVKGVVRKLGDKQFVAGFGNNGGEEFLSYMNISETLVMQGGENWEQWDQSVSKNLAQVQNGDGSWSGHHCITGRTFCTATALLTLMADRSPGQLAAQIKNQKN